MGNVSVLEIGKFHDAPNITRVFYTESGAIKAVPVWFERIDNAIGIYYEDKINEEWLTIKTYRVEV
jgi:hypothetical protein